MGAATAPPLRLLDSFISRALPLNPPTRPVVGRMGLWGWGVCSVYSLLSVQTSSLRRGSPLRTPPEGSGLLAVSGGRKISPPFNLEGKGVQDRDPPPRFCDVSHDRHENKSQVEVRRVSTFPHLVWFQFSG